MYTYFHMKYRIGIDEVGRGPIAGPVVVCACAVLQDTDVLSLYPKSVLRDSKKLSEKAREKIKNEIEVKNQSREILWGIGEISASRIDEVGIVPAIKDALNEALTQLEKSGVDITTEVVLDGGLTAPERYLHQEMYIKGDEKFVEISLASIIAKVYRDNLMKGLAREFPEYGFENHVGYGTKAHYEAITRNGMTIHHRRSFLKKLS
jgi:ribonuclease HII